MPGVNWFVRFVGSFWDGAITSPYTGQCMLKQCPKGQKFQHTLPFRPCGGDLGVFGAVVFDGLYVWFGLLVLGLNWFARFVGGFFGWCGGGIGLCF